MRLLHLALPLTLALVPSPSSAEITVSKYPKVYKGREGVIVVVVPLAPTEKKQALIKVAGIDTVIDGQVFLYDLASETRAEGPRRATPTQVRGSALIRGARGASSRSRSSGFHGSARWTMSLWR